MTIDGSWEEACIAYECPNKRLFVAPFCRAHLLDSWRYVEANPEMKPAMPPKLVRKARRDAIPKAPTKPAVYYFRLTDGRIKIGTSTHLAQRAASLGVDWPHGVLAIEWGGTTKEAERHAQFADHRHYDGASSTEIFAATDALMAHIADLRAENGDPQRFLDEQLRIFEQWRDETRQRAVDHGAVQAALDPNAPRRT